MGRGIRKKRGENPLSNDSLLSRVKELKSRGMNWRQIKRELHIGSNRLTRLWKIMRSQETGTIEIPPPAESEILNRTMNKATSKISSTLSEMIYQEYIDAIDAGRVLKELENRYKISVKEMGYEWDDFVRQSIEISYTNLKEYKSIRSSMALIPAKGENSTDVSPDLSKPQITIIEKDKNGNDKVIEDFIKIAMLLFLIATFKQYLRDDRNREYEAEIQRLGKEIDDIATDMKFNDYIGELVSALDGIRDAIEKNGERIYNMMKNLNENSPNYNENTRILLQSISSKIDALLERFSPSNGCLTLDQVDLLKDQIEWMIKMIKRSTPDIENGLEVRKDGLA